MRVSARRTLPRGFRRAAKSARPEGPRRGLPRASACSWPRQRRQSPRTLTAMALTSPRPRSPRRARTEVRFTASPSQRRPRHWPKRACSSDVSSSPPTQQAVQFVVDTASRPRLSGRTGVEPLALAEGPRDGTLVPRRASRGRMAAPARRGLADRVRRALAGGPEGARAPKREDRPWRPWRDRARGVPRRVSEAVTGCERCEPIATASRPT